MNIKIYGSSKLKLIFIILSIFSNTAYAEWIKVASTQDDDAVFYVSSESIIKNGKYRTAWEVVNHSHGTREGYISLKAQQEYDCSSMRVRILYASLHSEEFGQGKTILIVPNTPLKWQTMPSNSVATYTRDYICNKK